MPNDYASRHPETMVPSKYKSLNGQRPFTDAEIDNLLAFALVVSEGLEQLRREGRLITNEKDERTRDTVDK